ncbi:MAG: RNA polymerase sigma factor [Clostridia bacterium]|nr:RNA polymerase sigma factor [Clostridia bacterium]
MDDGRIVELFLQRDEAAIREVEAEYGARLRAIAYGVCGDDGIADECVNSAYLAAWDAIPPHEPRNYLFAFMARIVRTEAIDRVRHETRLMRCAQLVELSHEAENAIPASIGAEDEISAKELSRAVSRFLRTVPEEKRNIFIRRYWFADPVSEIAKRFSSSESRIKSILFRTRIQLREYLEKEGFEI